MSALTSASESKEAPADVGGDAAKKKKVLKPDMKKPQQIVEHLFLGGLLSYDYIEECGIEAILNCATELGRTQPDIELEYGVKHYLSLSMEDTHGARVDGHFDTGVEFIANNVTEGRNVLVHCFEGKSRSSALVLAFLMAHKKMTLKAAYRLTKSKRRIVRPNNGFWKALMQMEMDLFGESTVSMDTLPSGPKFFDCPYCGKTCGLRPESLQSHVKYKHKDKIKSSA